MNNAIRILYVDDEPDELDLVETFLKREDERFEMLTAMSAEEGITYLDDEPVDCVVSDYKMPGMDGIQFLEAIRDDHPHLPFILSTSQDSEAVASDAITAGATDYFQKSSEPDQLALLAHRITNAIEQAQTTETRSELANEQDQRTALFENTPDPIMEVGFDAETPIIKDVNTAFEKTFGFKAVNTIGQPVSEAVVPDGDVDKHKRLKQNVLERNSSETEVRRETKDGVRDFRLHLIPIDTGDGSKGAYARYTDITDQKEHRQRLSDLHDVTRGFMQATSREEVTSLAVEAGRDILKLPYTHFYGLSDDNQQLTPVAATEQMYDRFGDLPTFTRGNGMLWNALNEGTVQQYDDVQAVDDLASDLPFRGAIIGPVGDYGVYGSASLEPSDFDTIDRELASILIAQMEAALGAVRRQQTLRARERELERKNEQLEAFTGIVSHDLRNPLNVVAGRVELAQEECDTPHLDVIDGALTRMDQLINQTLTLARSGQVIAETEPVDLSHLIEQCWENVDTGEATLRVETVPEIEADPVRLRQLVENLYRNAVEHGSKDVTVTVGKLPDGFYIEDDGSGILESERDAVFDIGYSTDDGGTGFGLSIVKRIVEAHDWDIRPTEGSDGGARFEITGVTFAAE
jgi:PAS domain S-box-containing protein